ncbi:hypothetical protein RRG08_017417 [Elysia crispata]|uniref:Uncharacterized protein n=1 Tax=Elysia crispata TaxID=231223 RepID=A0AAE0ZNS4_9GAST|nr:hypothetical protein RRG08_017417 [Elysia crispata]
MWQDINNQLKASGRLIKGHKKERKGRQLAPPKVGTQQTNWPMSDCRNFGRDYVGSDKARRRDDANQNIDHMQKNRTKLISLSVPGPVDGHYDKDRVIQTTISEDLHYVVQVT